MHVDELSRKQNIIRDNYYKVIERINISARNAGRDPESIRLVVVTKTQPVEAIQYVIDAGATNLGESYVEEALPKIQALANNQTVRWHMIGHVQSRKAQNVCEYFQYVHSLDSVKLAERLNRFATTLDKPLPVWMEFNVSGEASKSGWDIKRKENWENILPDIEKIIALPKINILGVMTVPPYSIDPEASRPYYKRLHQFQQFIVEHFQLTGFNELSMGMSSDFEVAIQEGSTCVRIGQAILGPRMR
jgi:pyridoxal phosphate enzyme (YggS family)